MRGILGRRIAQVNISDERNEIAVRAQEGTNLSEHSGRHVVRAIYLALARGGDSKRYANGYRQIQLLAEFLKSVETWPP